MFYVGPITSSYQLKQPTLKTEELKTATLKLCYIVQKKSFSLDIMQIKNYSPYNQRQQVPLNVLYLSIKPIYIESEENFDIHISMKTSSIQS